jgi:glycerol-3-phosphate dehydrogenase
LEAPITIINCRKFGGGNGANSTRNFFRRLTRRNFSFQPNRDPGLAVTSVLSDPKEVEGPIGLPSRTEQLHRLQNPLKGEHDVLVIGGGATGAGIAFDAATRGLAVACIERGDFASETSSRSTKLIWAGIRYMATATAILISPKLLSSPIETVKDFVGEMKMVLNCHKERHYMMEKQEHLCNWIPIAIPFTTWHVSPPPFGHWMYGFFPILAPAVLKFYDSLSFFQCPPSYILTPSKARDKFPQLADRDIKYCAVFYEAQHNDARTNIAIAMSAAEYGASIANYVEMVKLITDPTTGKAIGVEALDRTTGNTFEIRAKKVVFAGGPFTDGLREMEKKDPDSEFQPAIRGAAGIHIVLPGYYCPHDVSTSIESSRFSSSLVDTNRIMTHDGSRF